MKELGWIWPQPLRELPWKKARYEPFHPNHIWGKDWSLLSIDGLRRYLLTIIDYFSRRIIAWGIVKTVTQADAQHLLSLPYLHEGIDNQPHKPVLHLWR